jgi:hypothetical protein
MHKAGILFSMLGLTCVKVGCSCKRYWSEFWFGCGVLLAAVAGGAQASAEAVAVATAAAAAIVGHERPCTVKLRLWAFDTVSPRKILEVSRLTISHAVLCSEMGVHFSPCGRYATESSISPHSITTTTTLNPPTRTHTHYCLSLRTSSLSPAHTGTLPDTHPNTPITQTHAF